MSLLCSEEHGDLLCRACLHSQPTLSHYYSPQVCRPHSSCAHAPADVYLCASVGTGVQVSKQLKPLTSLASPHSYSSFSRENICHLVVSSPSNCLTGADVYGESCKWLRSCVPAGFTSLQVE